jgi:glutaconyl-CoA/methylmalonyl-CoA decarboxylase subunit gamma
MKSFKFNIKGHDYDVEIRNFENNLAEIEVNGTLYQVEVKREQKTTKTPILVRSDQPAPRSAHKFKKKIGGHFDVKAPLPGNIMQIYVKEGEEVKKGDKLLMYEAMKMENILTAEKDGTITKIRVSAGNSVLQGDLLMEIA